MVTRSVQRLSFVLPIKKQGSKTLPVDDNQVMCKNIPEIQIQDEADVVVSNSKAGSEDPLKISNLSVNTTVFYLKTDGYKNLLDIVKVQEGDDCVKIKPQTWRKSKKWTLRK